MIEANAPDCHKNKLKRTHSQTMTLFSTRLTKVEELPVLLMFYNDYHIKENSLLKKKNHIKIVLKSYTEVSRVLTQSIL